MQFRLPAPLFAALVSLAATGCGLKGPLYSPDEKKETVGVEPTTEPSAAKRRPPAMPPAPQAQKEPVRDEAPAPPSTAPQAPVSTPDPDRPADAEPIPPPDR
jgi:predicted small lipoprotein YifL